MRAAIAELALDGDCEQKGPEGISLADALLGADVERRGAGVLEGSQEGWLTVRPVEEAVEMV